MTQYPGCGTTTTNTAENVGVMAHKVCGVDVHPYEIIESAIGAVNLYGTSNKLVVKRAAIGSISLYGTSNNLVIIESESGRCEN